MFTIIRIVGTCPSPLEGLFQSLQDLRCLPDLPNLLQNIFDGILVGFWGTIGHGVFSKDLLVVVTVGAGHLICWYLFPVSSALSSLFSDVGFQRRIAFSNNGMATVIVRKV